MTWSDLTHRSSSVSWDCLGVWAGRQGQAPVGPGAGPARAQPSTPTQSHANLLPHLPTHGAACMTLAQLLFRFFSLPTFFLASIYLAASDLTCGRWDRVVVRGLSCRVACEIPVPLPGIEPTSPALQGGFLTTGRPGMSFFLFFVSPLSLLSF